MYNNDYRFKVAWCRVCKQGWVEIVQEISTGRLFFRCDECETCWDYYEDIQNPNTGEHEKYGRIEEPTYEEIKKKGWEKYILAK